MARRRKKREEVQSYNYSQRESNGSVGLSKAALEALNSGTYGSMTNRKPKYTKASEQNFSQRRVPALEGMSRSASFSSRPKKQNETKPVRQEKRSDVRQERKSLIDTDRARRNYAAQLSAPSMEFTKEIKATQTPTPKKKETAAPVLTTSQKQIVNALEKSVKEEPKEEKGINIERARRNYAKNATKPSSRYENKNIKTDLGVKETGRDKSYDKDFDEFFDWRYNKADVRDYDPASDTETEHWRNVKKDIMAKNKWSDKEFEDKWKAYNDERWKAIGNEEVSGNIAIAKEHPVAGTLIQALYTPETWMEGLATGVEGAAAGLGKLTGKNPLEKYTPTEADSPLFTATRTKEGIKQEVRDNHIKTDLGRQAYEAGTGLLDMAMSQAIPGGAAWMGATKGANRQMQSLERGVDPEKAAMVGALSGANSAVMNKVGLDWALGTSGKTLLGTLGKAANREGLENVAEDLVDMGIDKLINGDESELDALHDYYVQNGGDENVWLKVVGDKLKELGTSYISGGVMGGAFGAAKNLPALHEMAVNKWAQNNFGIIPNDPNIRAILEDAMEPTDVTERAAAQQAEALENIQKLQEQLPEIPKLEIQDADFAKGLENAKPDNSFSRMNALFEQSANEAKVPELVEAAPEAPAEAAYEQATDKINGDKWVTLDDIKSEEEPYEDTSDVKPTIEAVKPVMREGEGLQGEELTKAQEQVKKNKSDINALQNEIDILTKDKSNYWRGQLKKDVQKSIKARENTIKKLKSENTDLNRSIKGKEVPIRQQFPPELYDEIYGRKNSFAGDIYAALKLAGNTKEATQYAADAKQALANYINTGEMYPHLRQFAENLNALGRLAHDSGNTYGETGGYEEWFGKNNLWDYELGRNYLDGIRRFHAERNAANAPAETPEAPTEVAASAPVEEAPRAEIPENPANGSGNVPPERPLITEPVESDDIGRSRVITRSARSAGIVDDYEYENDPVIKGITEYAKHHNEQTYESALNEVRTNGSKLLEEYNSDERIIDNDKDVDQAMLLLRNLKEQIKGKSPEEVGDLITQKNMLLSRLRKAGTKYGQAIQAFAKWNDTPEGALINGERILKDRVDAELTRNTKVKDATDKAGEALANIGNETTENYRIRNDGKYQLKKEGDPNEATSKYLDKALRKQGYDGTMEPEPKAPKSHEQHRVEVENSIRRELGSVADRFTDNDFEYLTNLVENKVPIDTIIDEIEHKLNHGEWYTIDESTPIKKETSSKLTKILKNMGNDARKASNKVPEVGDITYPAKSHATIAKEVGNTLESEPAAVELNNPNDVDFITTMIEDGVPDWQIEDEISHRLLHGEWYELDKSVEQPKPENSKLRAALNALVDEGERPEKVELTRDEIREQVRNTLDKEFASMGTSRLYTDQGEWTDEDVDYITNLIQNGATKEELTDALRTKLLTGTFSISADTQTKVNRLFEYADKFDPNSKEACEAKAAAYKLIAEETCGKATAFEKFEAWRYLAMLGNPKTMMRNTVGNGLFNAVTSTSNSLSAVLEGATDAAVKGSKKGINKIFGTDFDTSKGIQRRKALLNPVKDGSLIKAAHADADAKRYKQIKGSKYEKGSVKDKIKAERSVFDNKLIQLYERATDAGISDYQFVKAKYATSLAGYMKANGMSESAFDAEPRYKELQAESKQRVLTDAERSEMDSLKQTMDDLDKARDYALKQAEYATFHEENAVAKWISDASRNAPKAGKWLIEGTIPFKKTPANIVRSGFEYSPLGAIKSVADTGKLIYENTGSRKNYADTYITKGGKEKTKTLVADVLDSWSKTLTGTGLAALGYFLHNRGILNSSTNDEKYQDELEGKQNYSITVNGHTVTLDWAAPAVMPLLMGAEMSKIKQNNNLLDKKIYENFDEVISTVNAILDPMIETSMMQGVKNTIEDAANEVRYNDNSAAKLGGMMGSLLTGAATNYLTQVVPTLSGQLARTVDPMRRATDTISGGADNSAIAPFEKQGRRLMNKIPFLSMLNEPYRDAYGRTQKNSPTDSGLGSLLYQSVSPAYVDKIDVTDADKSARGAYMGYDESVPEEDRKPIMDKGVFATWKGKVTVDGHKLDPKEMSVYREKSGNAQYDIRDALAKEEWFNNLDGAKQTDILKKVNTLVDKIGKEAAGYPQSGDDINAFNSGKVPDVLDYLKTKSQSKAITDAGLSSNSKEAKAIKEAYAEGDEAKANKLLEQAQKDQAPAQELDMSTDHYQKVMNVAKDKSDRVKQDIPKLRGMGMPESSDYVYANAVNKEPNITIDTFVKQYKEIDTNKADKLTQKEMLEHFNKKRLPEAEVMRLWTVYQQGDWKRVPYLKKDGTWGVHDAK